MRFIGMVEFGQTTSRLSPVVFLSLTDAMFLPCASESSQPHCHRGVKTSYYFRPASI
ncbi:hypothetical protein Fuma_05707 [Fuerstiella marisgermanici]|uniref:Uncharacterized protein n=1 Tax=Fuerstiella marisgermanici TaxID=1891926 RepID=A0A1P8WPQ6_9PLAN|nr:hypothetical protein Fuma_05707 [Fuerstiella marisgermanici]